MSEKIVFSRGSFFHGTKADLKIEDFIITGKKKIITMIENLRSEERRVGKECL